MKRRISTFAISIGALCIIWEICIMAFKIPSYVLPSPYAVVIALINERNQLLYHGMYSMFEAIAGLLIACVLAVIFAVLMDRFQMLKLCIYPFLVITQTIPIISIAPLLIIYVGIGIQTKILAVVLMCFFPIAVNTADGMQSVNENQVGLVKLFGASNFQTYIFVKIPAALSSFFSGLKVAATYSMSGAIIGEWLASNSGLGYYIIRAKNGYMLDNVFACIVVIILISLFLNALVKAIQFVAMPYLRGN